MVQLKLLSGKKAGTCWSARKFPIHIGRGAAAEVQIEEDGVWEAHACLDFIPGLGFVFRTEPNAIASLNNSPLDRAVLRNGDIIQLGSARVQFWLSETRQSGLRFHEWVNWAGIVGVAFGQIGLIYWLLYYW